MNETGFPEENKPKEKKSILSRVWVASLVLLVAVFAFVSVPGLLAQGRSDSSASAAQAENRRYTAIIQQVFDFIQRNHIEDVDSSVLFEGAMTGIFQSLGDPNSAFLPRSQMRGMTDTTQGNFGGVGLLIHQSRPATPGGPVYVEVASPIEGTPGASSGISAGDLIIAINDEPTETLSMDQVLDRLRGPLGTDVNLMVRRGEKTEFPVTITRARIEVPTAQHAMIDGGIGYLRLLTFTPMTVERAKDAIASFKENGYSAMILDLRDNTGGRLDSAIDVSSLFLEGGTIVSTRSRIPSENRSFGTSRESMVDDDIPIIVLINRRSASASEIVAGALKDRHRALLVGETTFGKGSVQQVFPLNNVNNSGFRLTIARYYTPSDASIDGIGIPPDRLVRFPDFTDADAEELTRLVADNPIPDFVKNNPNADRARVDNFVRQLGNDYRLDPVLLRRLVRNEQNRARVAPVFDLDYDVQLQEAVNILSGGSFENLLRSSKTIQELQDQMQNATEGVADAA